MTEFGKLRKVVAAFRMVFAIGVCQLWPIVRADDVNSSGMKGNVSLIRLQIDKPVNVVATQESSLPVKPSVFKLHNTSSENSDKQASEKRSEIYVVHNGLLFLHPRKVTSTTGVRKSSGEDSSSSINYHVIKKSNINTTGRIIDTDLLQIGMVSRGAVMEEPKYDAMMIKSKRELAPQVIDTNIDASKRDYRSIRRHSAKTEGADMRDKSNRSVIKDSKYSVPQDVIQKRYISMTAPWLGMPSRAKVKRQLPPQQTVESERNMEISSSWTGEDHVTVKHKRMISDNPIFDENQPENEEAAWRRHMNHLRHRRHRKHHRRHHPYPYDVGNLRHFEAIKDAYPIPKIESSAQNAIPSETLDLFTEYPRYPKEYHFNEMPRFPHPKPQFFIYPRFPHPRPVLETYPRFPAIKPIEELREMEVMGSKRSPESYKTGTIPEDATSLSDIPGIRSPEKIPAVREIPEIPDIPGIPSIPFLRSIPFIHDIKPIPPAEALRSGDVSVTSKSGVVKKSSNSNA